MEVISYLRKNWKESGLIVTIDFEKCFDHIEHRSIMGVFKYFGFGSGFVSMLKLLYANFELCTTSHGYTSQFMKKTRGTNQGFPGSPLVYSYCGEIMSHLVLNNSIYYRN